MVLNSCITFWKISLPRVPGPMHPPFHARYHQLSHSPPAGNLPLKKGCLSKMAPRCLRHEQQVFRGYHFRPFTIGSPLNFYFSRTPKQTHIIFIPLWISTSELSFSFYFYPQCHTTWFNKWLSVSPPLELLFLTLELLKQGFKHH